MGVRHVTRIGVVLLSLTILGCSLPARIGFVKEPYSPLPEDLPAPLTLEDMLLVLNDRASDVL